MMKMEQFYYKIQKRDKMLEKENFDYEIKNINTNIHNIMLPFQMLVSA